MRMVFEVVFIRVPSGMAPIRMPPDIMAIIMLWKTVPIGMAPEMVPIQMGTVAGINIVSRPLSVWGLGPGAGRPPLR